MSFFYTGARVRKSAVQGVSLDTLHKAGCQICPLNHIAGNKNPHMPAHGTTRPRVYFLGEAPGATEDQKGRPFVGEAGHVLRFRVPNDWLPDIRMNNVVRTRPPKNRDPAPIEMECCRPSVQKDIEETQPEAIFGFGNIPLTWAGIKREGDRSGISVWAGRRVPVKIGSHVCWYFPILHPSAILHTRRFEPRRLDEYGCDEEFAFALHLEEAFRQVDAGLPDPNKWLISREEALANIETVWGADGDADVDRVVEFLKSCEGQEATGLDWETSRLRPYEPGAKLLSAGLAREGAAFSFGLDHPGCKWTDKQRRRVGEALENFLYECDTRKISFNLPFEMEWAAWGFGPDCLRAGEWGDAQSQAYVLDERQGGLSLDFCVMQNFGLDFKAISNVDTTKLEDTPIEEVTRYNALDGKFHRELWFVQEDRIKDEGLEDVYIEQERRAPTMVLSQLQGVPIDPDKAEDFADKYETKKADVEDEMAADPDLKDFLKAKGLKKYEPGANSRMVGRLFRWLGYEMEGADEAQLKQIDHPLAEMTIEWRKAETALTRYIYACIKDHAKSKIYPDFLIHYIISICKTRTWRTASEGPNIQNFPKRDEELKEIRAIVCAMLDDHDLRLRYEKHFGGADLHVVSFDYAGIQARNIAMESRDERLIQHFWDRYDIHTDWMERVQRIYPKWCDPKKLANDKGYRKAKRHKAKNGFVFPSFFGAQPKKTAGELEVPVWVMEDAREEFFSEFPDVLKWQEELKADYFRLGYVTGHSGFRRRAPVEQNQIINSPIQADEAIIVCDAMSRLSEMNEPRFQAMMEIHDDLTFLWPKRDIERNAEVVINTMLEVPFEWANIVPIEIEMSVGRNWAEQEEVGAFASDTWKGKLTDDQRKKIPRAA